MERKKAVRQLKQIQKLIIGKKMRLAAQWPVKWKSLIATIMASQTRDEVTIPAAERLFSKYPSMKALSKAPVRDVERLISSVNFYRNKAKHVVETAKILAGRRIPKTTEELIKLPGVGRKVANVYLADAEKMDELGVDTHVARISYKLGWTKNKNPDKVEADLRKLFPRKYWGKINEILVIFGKSIGLSRRREDAVLDTL